MTNVVESQLMKRCLNCNSIFPDHEQFCEVDGSPLVTAKAPSDNSLIVVVAVLGLTLGVLISLGYLLLARTNKQPEEQFAISPSQSAQTPQPRPVQAVPPPSESPSEEPSPSPTESPSPSPQSTTTKVELSSSPISTASGQKEKTGPVIIKLNDGVIIEADEAWQTGEGIWYRRRGVVTLLDPRNVKTIERPSTAPAQASPSAQPTK